MRKQGRQRAKEQREAAATGRVQTASTTARTASSLHPPPCSQPLDSPPIGSPMPQPPGSEPASAEVADAAAAAATKAANDCVVALARTIRSGSTRSCGSTTIERPPGKSKQH